MSDQKIRYYKDLKIWQKGILLVKEVYKITEKMPRVEVYGLTNQIRRSAVSIPSNIAEGQSRQHEKEFKQFLYLALGSLAELETQLIIANELNYVNREDLKGVGEKIVEIRKMTSGLISRLTTNR